MLHRPRFRIHLSTAIILMFAAGGIMWANIRTPNGALSETELHLQGVSLVGYYIRNTGQIIAPNHGWPIKFFDLNYRSNDSDEKIDNLWYSQYSVSYPRLSANILANLAILSALWYACERWIARKH